MRLGQVSIHPQSALDLTQYLDGLYGYALILTRNGSQAEDLVQETCLRALRAMARLRPESNPKSWLFTILRNTWLNQLRQAKTAGRVVALDTNEKTANLAVDTAHDLHSDYVATIEHGQVRNAIRQLPVKAREIILLREYEELSYGEIARLLRCPVGTVMSRLARARSKLRDFLPAPSMVPLSEKEGTDDKRGTGL
jgi:RNA polymerase sigma-70 factor, ECF subfamily